MGKLTIKEIANRSGVSISTVSRVINNNGSVDKNLKERVQRVLEETNFRPNISARTLKSNRTNSIGLIISDISDHYYSRMTKCLTDLLAEHGYSLLICCTNGSSERECDFFEFLADKNVDGMILNSCGENDSEVLKIAQRIPTVLVNRQLKENKNPAIAIDYVGSDDISGMFDLTMHLIKLGHDSIGLINGNPKLSTAMDRMEGFRKAISMAPTEIKKIVHQGSFSHETGYEGMKSMLSNSQKPSAIIASNDSIALGVMQYVKDAGIKIPDDISFVTYGDIENSSLFFVKPTCMTSDPTIVGRYALNCILDRLANPKKPSSRIVFSTTFCEGNSAIAK